MIVGVDAEEFGSMVELDDCRKDSLEGDNCPTVVSSCLLLDSGGRRFVLSGLLRSTRSFIQWCCNTRV